MTTAALAAPEIDRLVLAVNTRTSAAHGNRFATLARGLGLDSARMLGHFAEFLLAGRLARGVAIARMPYAPAGAVADRLDELAAGSLIEATSYGYRAADPFRPLLTAIRDARAEVASELWSVADDDVAMVEEAARLVIAIAGPEYPVARAHGALPEPGNRHLRLHQRLTTLRYIRAHAHAAAWRDRGLEAAEIVAMTRLWRGEDAGGPVPATLFDRGYVAGDPPALTTAGVAVRESIEEETNRIAQPPFDALDPGAAGTLVAALGRLPGTPV